MSLEKDVTEIKMLVETNDAYIDDPDPSGLVHAAHDPKNCKLIWWYNPATAEFVKSNDPKHLHALDIGNAVKDYEIWIRGRVFDYQNKNYLIIYYIDKKGITSQQLADIYDKADNNVDKPITQVIDDNGRDIGDLFESLIPSTIERSKLGAWKINEYGIVIECEIDEADIFKPGKPTQFAARKEILLKDEEAEKAARHADGIYYYDELSEEAKQRALEWGSQLNVDSEWWDDDAFFEPSQAELVKAGTNGEFIFEFDKLYFDIDRGAYVSPQGLTVTNEEGFYNWLGIPKRMREDLYYYFDAKGERNVSLVFEKQDNSDFTPQEIAVVEAAEEKFADHVENMIKQLRDSYEYLTGRESVEDTIRANEYEFDEDGNRT